MSLEWEYTQMEWWNRIDFAAYDAYLIHMKNEKFSKNTSQFDRNGFMIKDEIWLTKIHSIFIFINKIEKFLSSSGISLNSLFWKKLHPIFPQQQLCLHTIILKKSNLNKKIISLRL